ncbi:MAG: zf-HC2 domain-containing protein [Oscillospiraceae bacterium]
MDSCERYLDLISGNIDGMLSEAEESELSEHLKKCEACRELLELMEKTHAAMGDLLADPPRELCDGIMYKVGRESGSIKTPRRFAFGRFTAIAAMLAVVLLAVYALPNLFGRNKSGLTADGNAQAPLMEKPQYEAAAPAEKDEGGYRAYTTFDRAAGKTEAVEEPAAVPAPEAVISSEPEDGEDYGETQPMLGITSAAAGAPALPYSEAFSAIVVWSGDMPEELKAYPSEAGAEAEVYVFVPTGDLEAILAKGDYILYRDEPNTDPSADTAIFVVYGG